MNAFLIAKLQDTKTLRCCLRLVDAKVVTMSLSQFWWKSRNALNELCSISVQLSVKHNGFSRSLSLFHSRSCTLSLSFTLLPPKIHQFLPDAIFCITLFIPFPISVTFKRTDAHSRPLLRQAHALTPTQTHSRAKNSSSNFFPSAFFLFSQVHFRVLRRWCS